MTETQDSSSKSSGRFIPALLFFTAALPVLAAFYMYFSGSSLIPADRVNKGTLVVPTLAMDKLDLQLVQAGEGEIEGKWKLLVFGSGACETGACKQSLYYTRQVNIALGREAGRVVRYYINTDVALDEQVLTAFETDYPRLHIQQSNGEAVAVFLDKTVPAEAVVQDSYIFIADPLGNVMMYYTPENEGGDILDDLKKLLKVSKIG